jgi:predicted transposase YbfD/YdcC
VHLLAAMDHTSRGVLAQRQVGGAPEEVPAFAPLLARLKRLPWHHVPVLDRTRDRGHGRVEVRTLKAVSVHHFGFPHAAQVLQVTRKTRDLHDHPRRFTTVTVYAITSLTHAQASPARLADLIREHWAIEALHHVRDTTFAEDASQIRTDAGPHVMATLRNLVIGVLCRTGPVNVAAAPRRHARDPRRPPRHPRDQPRMKPTSRQNDRAWGQISCRGSAGRGVRPGDPAMPPYRQLTVHEPFWPDRAAHRGWSACPGASSGGKPRLGVEFRPARSSSS